MQITSIDGEQKLIHFSKSQLREGSIGAVDLEKGMPKNAVKNGPRGNLTISLLQPIFGWW
jgi:hypothetical protein